MRKNNDKVLAILCADLHLSAVAPVWRSAEPNWFGAMRRVLEELTLLQFELDGDVPILCAGDIFDKWYGAAGKQGAELINFALEYLPDNMYCIPGQHDLPDHNYAEIERSAYWTLVKAGKIHNINEEYRLLDGMVLRGFPFGSEIKPCCDKRKRIRIALIHEYRWMAGHSYPKATMATHMPSNLSELGYDVIVYGDNHKGFHSRTVGNRTVEVLNCGTLMRRASDEIDYKPMVGLLLADGTIKSHYLDTSQDKFIESVDESAPIEEMDMSEFIAELTRLGEVGLDFVKAMERLFKSNKTKKVVKEIIRKGMDK